MCGIDLNQILRESLPRWTQAEFLFLESEPWWAPSVQTELARTATTELQLRFGNAISLSGSTTDYRCHSVRTTRSIYEQVRTGRVAGVVLIVEQQMRDSLLLLGRLSRLGRPCPPVLLVIPRNTLPLMPLLLESGAAAVMVQMVTDIQVADWCRRAAAAMV